MRRRRPGLSIVVLATFAGLAPWPQPLAARAAPRPRPEPAAQVALAVNQLGLDLYAQLRDDAGNLVLSPASIGFALGMVHAGAATSTAAAMTRAMHLEPYDAAFVQDGFAALAARAGAYPEGVTLRIANRLWAQKGLALARRFLGITREKYGAEATVADFAQQAETARKAINAWVGKATRGRIQDLLPGGSITSATALVIVNAIWFKGEWQHEFDEAATRDAPFHRPRGEPVDVKMMSMRAPARLAVVDHVRVLELGYRGGELSMVLLLPDDPDGFAALERRLSAANLRAWIDALAPVPEVDVRLPRWKATRALGLGGMLRRLGMDELFSEAADLSGMLESGAKGLSVSDAFHKAFIEVNEKGAEAAAATAVVILIDSVQEAPPVFHADRPFVWLIRDNRTGLVLFVGRVVDPR